MSPLCGFGGMMKTFTAIVLGIGLVIAVTVGAVYTQAQQRGDSVRGDAPVDVLNMERPIEIHDSVWIGELTTLEVRDLVKTGKTTALILGGGMEENGPYLTLDKHNNVARAMGEAIARKLGNALCAPILTMEPGNPEKPSTPGGVVFSAETYKAVLTDMATSLRAMGFKNIIYLGDHGGDLKPMSEVAAALNAKWKGAGATNYFVEKYGNSGPDSGCCGFGVIEKYETDALGIHEKKEGLHDDYYISSMIMTVSQNGVRLPERIKAKKSAINGVDLAPAAKAIENGKKMIAYRADVTVKEIQRMMAASKTSQ
jgi:creatinine amidohydrolase/Fe(II)-dependent formamide hydrolase-like protein